MIGAQKNGSVEDEGHPLDQGLADGRGGRRGRVAGTLARWFSIYGLLLTLVALIVVFSVLKPNTFPTNATLRGILDSQSVVALLALAVMVPLATNQFDLSVGYVVAFSNSLVVGLQVKSGVSWELAIAITIAAGIVIGVVNGLLVAYAQINSFIATLGSGTVVFGLANWYTNGQQLQGTLATGFTSLTSTVAGIPKAAFVVLIVGIVLWLLLEYLPTGRFLYAVGANPRASKLSGINPPPRITGAFAVSGALAAVAGVLLAASLQIGQVGTGPDFLLPAFAGALLGSTSIKPGRVNVWGTVIAVMVLAVATTGLQQLGAAFYVEYIFNGAILVVAVGSAGWVGRRKIAERSRESKSHALAERAAAAGPAKAGK